MFISFRSVFMKNLGFCTCRSICLGLKGSQQNDFAKVDATGTHGASQ